MENQFVYGYIDADGTLITGSGIYNIDHEAPGVYGVTFTTPFGSTPAVSATQVYNGEQDYAGGYLTDNAVIIYIDNTMAKFLTGAGTDHQDRKFSFIAVGPSND